MNCREFTIEFENRAAMGEAATRHLTVCADCREMSEWQTQLWLMFDRLKPIAAPPDFDFHVKAKIANAAPSDFRSPRLLPILRLVLPLSVAVLLLGLFVFNSTYFSDATLVPPIAQNEAPKTTLPGGLPMTDQLAFVEPEVKKSNTLEFQAANLNPANGQNESPKTASKAPKVKKIETQKAPVDNESGGGSRISSLSETTVRTPKGINLNSNLFNAPKVENLKANGGTDILSFFGIETATENGRRTVKSLAKNTVGERSGLKVGDVVENITGNIVTVLRGTQTLQINLQNTVAEPR